MSIRQSLQEISDRLSVIEWVLRKQSYMQKGEIIMLEGIKEQVERNRQVDESVKVLLTGLKAKLDELASRPTVDPAEVKALADELAASNDELAAAVVANTPSA